MQLGGVQFRETIKIVSKEKGISLNEDELNKIQKLKIKFLNEKIDLIKPFNILEDLIKLKNQGIKLYIVTSSKRVFVEKVISIYFKDIFEKVLCAEDFKNRKPHPEPYLKAFELCGEKEKENCFVVEDAPSGVKSGIDGGFRVLSVLTSNTRENLKSSYKIFENHEKLFDFIWKEL